jgi:GNAT superfamily N-acetyltransferase
MALGYVRAARPDDAGEVARIQVATWRTACHRILPVRVLDQLDQRWIARRWRDAVERPPTPRHRVLVAIEQAGRDRQAGRDHLVGFAASGPADEHAADPAGPPLPGDTAAITDLLVEPRWGRRGHGSRLLSASVDLWRGDGFTTAVAWVFDADPATRGLLTSAGWAPDGAGRSLDVDDLLVPQVRLHTALPET